MSILSDIIEVKKEEIKILHRNYTLNRFHDSYFFEQKCISFAKAIKNEKSISLIAEIKKASPSKGIIKKDFNHIKIADIYFEAGVEAISVLTDKTFFLGSADYLKDIAKFKSAPLLRKDFIIDEYQVYEAKSNGADAILLVCEILSENQIKELTHCANENGMDVLLELHSKEELGKIDFSKNNIIGINNRNLLNFEVNLNTTEDIAHLIPKGVLIVSESGIKSRHDFDFLIENEINAALIGEYIMTAEKMNDRLKEIKEWSSFEN